MTAGALAPMMAPAPRPATIGADSSADNMTERAHTAPMAPGGYTVAYISLPSTDYEAWSARLGKRSSLKVGNNTRLETIGADAVALVLHGTAVVTVRKRDSWLVIDTAGWDTVTTWDRVNGALPAPYTVYSVKGTRYLHSGGRAILPYVDRLAVNLESGDIGMAAGRTGDVDVLMTAADVMAARDAVDEAQNARALKRAARLARQHPAPRPVTYRADVIHSRYGGYGSPLPSPHGRVRAYDCPSCASEAETWAAMRRAVLAADHANGHAWSVDVNGGTISEPAGECPWDCPQRPQRYGY